MFERKRIATAACFLGLLLTISCQSDSEISASIEGKWRGTLAEVKVKPFGLPIPFSDDDPSFDTFIEFKPDGILFIHEDPQLVEGTYHQSNENLSIDIDYSVEDSNLSGRYTIETLTETSLVIYVRKDGEKIIDSKGAPTVKGQIKITLHFQRL